MSEFTTTQSDDCTWSIVSVYDPEMKLGSPFASREDALMTIETFEKREASYARQDAIYLSESEADR